MTSTLIENLVEGVSQNSTVLPHILFDEIANTLNERFHNYHVVDSLAEIDWAFCSEHFMYESFRERVTVEERPERKQITYKGWQRLTFNGNPENPYVVAKRNIFNKIFKAK